MRVLYHSLVKQTSHSVNSLLRQRPSELLSTSVNPLMRHFSTNGYDDSNDTTLKNPLTPKRISDYEGRSVGSYKDDLLAISNSIRNSSIRVPIHDNLVHNFKSYLNDLNKALFQPLESAFPNDVKILCLHELINNQNNYSPYQIMADYDDIIRIK